jgi:hypothetical protein
VRCVPLDTFKKSIDKKAAATEGGGSGFTRVLFSRRVQKTAAVSVIVY